MPLCKGLENVVWACLWTNQGEVGCHDLMALSESVYALSLDGGD